jgi:hypothetical protein
VVPELSFHEQAVPAIDTFFANQDGRGKTVGDYKFFNKPFQVLLLLKIADRYATTTKSSDQVGE